MKGISYGNGHRRRRLGYSTLALSIGLVCASQQARAQAEADDPSEGRLSDIVVTALKRSENPQKVPIPVAAVSADRLQAAGVVSSHQLSSAVAGLPVNQTPSYFPPPLRRVGPPHESGRV